MNRTAIRCIFFLLQLIFIGIAHASDINDKLLDCSNQKFDELMCYRKIVNSLKPQTTSNPSEVATDAKASELLPNPPGRLAKEWDPSYPSLMLYKQNYVLVYDHSSAPNNAPTSPNPINVVPYGPLDNKEMKFQFSLKNNLFNMEHNCGGGSIGYGCGSIWFAYTQQSFWQVYDTANSRPFRESNYEPELIYAYRLNPVKMESTFHALPFDLTPRIINAGFVHQSNGQSNPRSRSWNRVYVQTGLDDGKKGKLSVSLRWWQRLKESLPDDDNPDITHYLGHGDIDVHYSPCGDWAISAIGKAHSLQLDLAIPWFFGSKNVNTHVQYFSGYGESLIDYNQHHNTWGIGASFPFGKTSAVNTN